MYLSYTWDFPVRTLHVRFDWFDHFEEHTKTNVCWRPISRDGGSFSGTQEPQASHKKPNQRAASFRNNEDHQDLKPYMGFFRGSLYS